MSHVRNRGIPSFASTVTQLNLASDTTARFEEPKATPADTECHASLLAPTASNHLSPHSPHRRERTDKTLTGPEPGCSK